MTTPTSSSSVFVPPIRWGVRNILFVLLAYGWTFFLCVALLWVLVLPRRIATAFITLFYVRGIDLLERVVLGVNWRITGKENLPPEAALIAMKHQSQWETLKLPLLFRDPVVVLKIELLRLPFWGWYAWKQDAIGVDRSKRAKAIPGMVAAAKARMSDARDIVIFPQGTRVPVGTDAPYKPGLRYLYQALECPVVPVAINSGCFVNKWGIMRQRGTIDVVILPPIPPHLPPKEMMQRLETILETTSNALAHQTLSGSATGTNGTIGLCSSTVCNTIDDVVGPYTDKANNA